MSPLAAVLTGGASSRMGGRPKGLLEGPSGEPLALRAARVFLAIGCPCVLVGKPAVYGALGLPVIDDLRPGQGPLGGLEAALIEAAARGAEGALLVACDMPYFTVELARRLVEAPPSPAAAFRRQGRFEPLFARYGAALLPGVQARLARGERSLQALLAAEGAAALDLAPHEERLLDDWDTPGDML